MIFTNYIRLTAITTCLMVILLPAIVPVHAAEPTAVAAQLTGSELVNLIIKAYGGEEALAKVRSLYTKGFAKTYQQDNDGPVNHYFQKPLKLRVEGGYHRNPETRILNGSKGWTGVGTAAQKEADRKAFEGLLFQYNYMDTPFSLIAGNKEVVYQGKDATGKTPVDVLVLKDMNGQEITLSVDEKTHLITKVSTPITALSTRDEVSVEFLDYREVDSIKMPFRIINFFGVHRVSETLISQIVINQLMEEKLFQP
jgi:hypothetical protein